MNRENLVSMYRALVGNDAELKAHVDQQIKQVQSNCRKADSLRAVAMTLTSIARIELGVVSHHVTDETFEGGGFLGGHTFQNNSRARDFVSRFLGQEWAEEWLPDTAD